MVTACTGRSSTRALADRDRGFPEAKLHDVRDHDSRISWHLRCDDQDLSKCVCVCVRQSQREKKESRSESCTQLYILVFAFRDMFPICEDAIMPLMLAMQTFVLFIRSILFIQGRMQPPASPLGPPHYSTLDEVYGDDGIL